MDWRHGAYLVTDDPARQDFDFVERMIRTSYWAADRPREVIEASFANSVCFALFYEDRQIGFARAVTDLHTVVWVCDVMVDPSFRGKGAGQFLVQTVVNHPKLVHLKMILGTKDAHTLYEKFGFQRKEMMRRLPPGEELTIGW